MFQMNVPCLFAVKMLVILKSNIFKAALINIFLPLNPLNLGLSPMSLSVGCVQATVFKEISQNLILNLQALPRYILSTLIPNHW